MVLCGSISGGLGFRGVEIWGVLELEHSGPGTKDARRSAGLKPLNKAVVLNSRESLWV